MTNFEFRNSSIRNPSSVIRNLTGTGRVQSVSRASNPKFWKLIEAFRRRTGTPLVLNTSFNENEPIVCTPQDALNCFPTTRMDALVLGNLLLDRSR